MSQNGDGKSSVGSSCFSTGSESVGHKGNLHFYTEAMPLFPMLQQLHAPWRPRMWIIVVILQCLQMLGFVVNTINNEDGRDWGDGLEILRKAVYFTHFPIWDPTFITDSSREVPCMVVFWLVFAWLGVSFAVLFAVFRDKGQGQVPYTLVLFVAQTLAVVGKVIFIPICNICLSFMICSNQGLGYLRSYPDEKCWDAFHLLHFIAGVMVLSITVLFAYMANVLLFEINPTETVLDVSKPHTHFDEVFLGVRLVLVILMHVILSQGESDVAMTILGGIILAVSVLLCVQLVVQLPLYNLSYVKHHVGCLCVVAWGCLLAILKPYVDESFVAQDQATILLLVGGAVMYVLGWFLGGVRVSGLVSKVVALVERGELDTLEEMCRKASFPYNLPNSEMHLARCAGYNEAIVGYDRENDTMSETAQGTSEMDPSVREETAAAQTNQTGGSKQPVIQFVYPYVSSVVIPSDVEVASRFLREYVLQYNKPCTVQMLGYALRLFAKGIVKYPGNSLVQLHLVVFLAYFAGAIGMNGVQPATIHIRAALAETEILMGQEVTMMCLYQLYLLQILMKPLIGMANDSHRKIVSAALKTYKDILCQMAMFWNKLLISENVDTLQLSVIANSVTSRRGEGLELFRKALAHPTYSLVRKYAQFLRQVMIDEDSAHTIEQKLMFMQREEKTNGAGKQPGTQSTNLGSLSLAQDAVSIDEKLMKKGVTSGDGASRGSSTIARLALTMNVTFSLLVIVLVGFFVVEAQLAQERTHIVEQAVAAAEVRSIGAQSAVIVQQIAASTSLGSTASSEELVRVTALKDRLMELARLFLERNDELSSGYLMPRSAEHRQFLQEDSCEIIDEVRRDGNGRVERVRSLVPLMVLGEKFGTALLAIAMSSSVDNAGGSSGSSNSASSGSGSDIGNALKLSDVDFVRQNALHTLGPALNRSVEFFEQAHRDIEDVFTWVLAACFSAALLLVFLVYLNMVVNFQKVGASKLATLNLFTYIPHVHLKSLAEEAAERVQYCEDDERDVGMEVFESTDRDKPQATSTKESSEAVEQSYENQAQTEEMRIGHDDETRAMLGGGEAGERLEGPTEESQADSEGGKHGSKIKDGSRKKGVDKSADEEGGCCSAIGVKPETLNLVVSLAVVFCLSIVCVLTLLVSRDDLVAAKKDFTRTDVMRTDVQSFYDDVNTLDALSKSFAQTGDSDDLEEYWKLRARGTVEDTHVALVFSALSVEQKRSYIEAASTLDSVQRHQVISQTLALDVHHKGELQEIGDLKLMSNFTWNEPQLDGTELTQYRGRQVSPPRAIPTYRDHDMRLSDSEKDELARSVVFNDRYELDVESIHNAMSFLNLPKPEISYRKTIHVTALTVICVEIVAVLCLLASARAHETISKLSSFQVLLSMQILFILTIVVLVGIVETDLSDMETWSRDYVRLEELVNTTKLQVGAAGDAAAEFSQFGNPSFLDEYVEEETSTVLDETINEAFRIDSTMNYADFTEAYELLYFLRTMERIALSRVANVFLTNDEANVYNDTRNWQTFRNFTYNIEAQGELRIEQQIYEPKPSPLRYVSSDVDARKSDDLQLRIARHTIAGPAYKAILARVTEKFVSELEAAKQGKRDKIQETHDRSVLLLDIAFGIATAMLGLFILYGTIYAVKFLSISDSEHEDFFPLLMRNCRLSLSLLAALICSAYAVSFYNQGPTEPIITSTNGVAKREWLVAHSLFMAQEFYENAAHDQIDSVGIFNLKVKLKKVLQAIRDNRETISDISGASGRLDRDSYGDLSHGEASTRIPGEGQFQCMMEERQPGPTQLLDSSLGVELAMLRWLDMLEQFSDVYDMSVLTQDDLSPANLVRFRQLRDEIVELEPVLFQRCSEATDIQTDHAKGLISSASSFLYLVLSLVLFYTVMIYLFVFRSMVNLLRNEEEGTKLMLTIVPQEVRETAPAIAEYLSTGVITLNDKIEEANEWIVEYSAVATVVIDRMGLVLRFSRAARDTFGYELEEVMGKNVKMLMPDDFAVKHDDYLAAYRKTGVRHIIGRTQKLKALRKNGSQFHVRLSVREMKKSGRDPIFIGSIMEITADLALERQLLIGSSIVKLSATPVIITDKAGKIVDLSYVAQNDLSLKIGGDIKQIMPPEVAEVHDDILKRYLKTGKKNVIGKTNYLEMMSRDYQRRVASTLAGVTDLTSGGMEIGGVERIKVELMVDQYFTEDGKLAGFIGYLRDLTEENLMHYSTAVSESIMNGSPNPMISIDQVGTITRFSQRATQVFGYSLEDTIGKNVKLIMPQEIAVHHDGYLARYLRTGEKKMINQTRSVDALHRDGSLLNCEVSIREVADSYIAYIRVTANEKRQKAEMDLQRRIMTLTSSSVITITHHGKIREFNPAAEMLFGYTATEATGANVDIIMQEDVGAKHNGFLQAYLRTGKKNIIDRRIEVTGKTKDGMLKTCELQVSEVEVRAGQKLFIGTLTDITERIKLKRLNLVNDKVSEMITSPLVVCDEMGTVKRFNKTAEEFFGWQANEIIGRNVNLLQTNAVAAVHDFILAEYKRTGKKKIIDNARTVECKRKGGQVFAAEIIVKEVKSAMEESTYMASFRDTSVDRQEWDLEQWMDLILQSDIYMFISITTTGKVLQFNKCAEKTFGYEASEVVGQNVKMLLPEEIARFHDSYLKTYAKTGVKRIIGSVTNSQAKKKDEMLIPVQLRVREIRQGNQAVFCAYIMDTLAHAAAELDVLLKDTLTEKCPSPLITTDLYGTVLTWPAAASRDTQWAAEDIIGKNIRAIQPPKIAKQHDKYLKRYLKTGVKSVIDSTREVIVRRRDGSYYPAELSLKELEEDGKKVYIGSLRDIGAVKEVMKKEKQRAAVLDLSLTAFLAITPLGEVTLWNKAATLLWGYDMEEVLGQNVKMLMPEPYHSEHDGYLAKYEESGIKTVINTKRILNNRRKDGSSIPVELSVKEIMAGETKAYIAQVVDATDVRNRIRGTKISDYLRQYAPNPLLVISETGTILSSSRAVDRVFGWTEADMLDQNINMLQPEEIAVFHDGYLERYKQTKVKRVIGTTREVRGKRRDNSTFAARIAVGEVSIADETVYVGCVQDIDQEIALKAEISRTNDILDLNTLGVITMGLDGIIQRVNKAVVENFYWEQSEMVGQNIKMLMPPEVAENHDTYLATYGKTRVKRIIDTKRTLAGKRKDSSLFVIEISVKEMVMQTADKQDLPPLFVGYIRDLTDEEKLKEAYQISSVIAMMSTYPSISIDADGRVMKYTPSAEKVWGWAATEVLSEKIDMLMPPETAAKHQGFIDAYIKTRKKRIIDTTTKVQALRKNGEKFWITLTVREVEGDGYFGCTFIGFLEDLTGQQKNRIAIKCNELLVEHSKLPIVKITREGAILDINQAGLQFFGYEGQNLLGQNINILVGAEHREFHDGYLKSYLQTGIKKVIGTTRTVNAEHRDGTILPVTIKVREIALKMQAPQYIGFISPMGNNANYETAKRQNDLIMDITQSATIVIDEHGTIQKFSSVAVQMFGWQTSDAMGKNIKVLMPDSTASFHQSRIDTYLKTKRRTMVGARTEVTAKHKNGNEIAVVAWIEQIDTESGMYFVGLFRTP